MILLSSSNEERVGGEESKMPGLGWLAGAPVRG